MFVIEGRVVDEFIVSQCLSLDGFDMSAFGLRSGNNVWVGLVC